MIPPWKSLALRPCVVRCRDQSHRPAQGRNVLDSWYKVSIKALILADLLPLRTPPSALVKSERKNCRTFASFMRTSFGKRCRFDISINMTAWRARAVTAMYPRLTCDGFWLCFGVALSVTATKAGIRAFVGLWPSSSLVIKNITTSLYAFMVLSIPSIPSARPSPVLQ